MTERRKLTSWRPNQETSGHRKNPTAGVLTSWRRHQEGQVRTRQQSDRAMGTHILETESGETGQNTETFQPSEGHSHTGRRHREGQVRTRKESDQARALTYWKPHREGEVRTWKNPTEQGALTSWRPDRGDQVKTKKETERARGTHTLEARSGETSEDTQRNRPIEEHSPTGDHIGRDKSGHGKNPTERGALTNWRPHREGRVRRKETGRARGTHQLETTLQGTSQDMRRNQPSKGHSHSRERIGRNKSGQ